MLYSYNISVFYEKYKKMLLIPRFKLGSPEYTGVLSDYTILTDATAGDRNEFYTTIYLL